MDLQKVLSATTTLMTQNVFLGKQLLQSFQLKLLQEIILLKTWFKIWVLNIHLQKMNLNQSIVQMNLGTLSVQMVLNFLETPLKKVVTTVQLTQMIVEKAKMLEQCFLVDNIKKEVIATIIPKMKNVWVVMQVLFMNFSTYMMKVFQEMIGNQQIVINGQMTQCVQVKGTFSTNTLEILLQLHQIEMICLIFMEDLKS